MDNYVDIKLETQQTIDKLKKEMGNISGEKLHTAISRAINHTIGKSKTKAKRDIAAVYNLKSSQINDHLGTKASTSRTLSGAVKADKYPLSLNEFNPEITTETSDKTRSVSTRFVGSVKKRRLVSSLMEKKQKNSIAFEIIKGKKESMFSAFLNMYNKNTGQLNPFTSGKAPIMARGKYIKGQSLVWGKPRLPIVSVRSSSTFNQILNKSVSSKVELYMKGEYPNRLVHEITKGLQYAK